MKCEQSVFIALDTNKVDRVEIDKSESRDSHFDNVGKFKDWISTFEDGRDAYMCVLPNESNTLNKVFKKFHGSWGAGSIPSRRPWSCISRNWSRLNPKMYIFTIDTRI